MEALQRHPVAERNISVFSLQHLGLYFGYEDREIGNPDENLHLAWIPDENQPRLSPEQTVAFVRLCIDMLDYDPRMADVLAGKVTLGKWAQTMEVSATIYRNYKTSELRFFVEPQVVTSATVASRSADESRPPIDLLTGEEMKDWQEEWHECGRAHSHNTMGTSPSTTDDNSEMNTPGFYMVFGEFARGSVIDGYKFKIFSSVITPYPDSDENVRRLDRAEEDEDGNMTTERISWENICEWPDAMIDAKPHANVWKNIMVVEPKEWKPAQHKITSSAWTGGHIGGSRSPIFNDKSSDHKGGRWFRFSEDIEEALQGVNLPRTSHYEAEAQMRAILNNLDDMVEKFGYDHVFTVFAPLLEQKMGFELSWSLYEPPMSEDDQVAIADWYAEAYETEEEDYGV